MYQHYPYWRKVISVTVFYFPSYGKKKTAISAVLGLAGAGLPTTALWQPAVASGAGYRKAQELARYE